MLFVGHHTRIFHCGANAPRRRDGQSRRPQVELSFRPEIWTPQRGAMQKDHSIIATPALSLNVAGDITRRERSNFVTTSRPILLGILTNPERHERIRFKLPAGTDCRPGLIAICLLRPLACPDPPRAAKPNATGRGAVAVCRRYVAGRY